MDTDLRFTSAFTLQPSAFALPDAPAPARSVWEQLARDSLKFGRDIQFGRVVGFDGLKHRRNTVSW